MRIDITSRTQPITAALEAQIQKQLGKLERFDVPFINPKFIIDRDGQAVLMEASIGLPSGELIAKAKDVDGYAALSALVQKLQRQLKTYVHKPNAHRAARSNRAQLLEMDGAADAA
ncbi:ribosome-associated translation inhibitor RaiA [Gallaecimonas kandeliae]|uniref:ribosome hibernation-promoting factor, HPF/YfiA family n=1 Tax=Gallaecimonas kandeliae TaxID=3029055 RepID=UPI00264A2D47|nr:ribosome-associated translation inhibitor RaiA [Gallaecimonas kandeliae]WKE66478.1 ribosome-associated translation inhibitor RaiA [Gallaecimonas kandeliae]